MHYLVIVNPKAGDGDAVGVAERIRRGLSGDGAEVAIEQTSGPLQATTLAEEAAREAAADVVVAVGGDGTLHEVVEGLARGLGFGEDEEADDPLDDLDGAPRADPLPAQRARPALGIVPVGTGNDFVRSVGIPHDPDGALAVLRRGERRRIDLGRAGERWFVNNLVVGYGAEVVHDMLDRGRLSRFALRGHAAYMAAGLRNMRYRPPERSVRVDGRTFRGRFFEVHIGNGRYCGGGISFVAGGTRPDDGLLDVTLMEHASFLETSKRLLAVRTASLRPGVGVQFLRARSLLVQGAHDIAYYLDGEAFTAKQPAEGGDASIAVSIVPGCLEVIAPG